MSSQPEQIKPKIDLNKSLSSPAQARSPAENFKLGQSHDFPHQPSQSKMSKSAPLIQRELKHILPRLNPKQRQEIADQFITQLLEKGVEPNRLQQNLSLSTINPEAITIEEISQVATYAYQHYPDIFEAVLTKPNVVQFLSSPILSAIVGIMAAKWLNQ